MSETLLKFLLDELDVVRVRCQAKGCGAVTEVLLANLAKTFAAGQCPVCREDFDQGSLTSLKDLARALLNCRKAKDLYRVEFVLPAKPDK